MKRIASVLLISILSLELVLFLFPLPLNAFAQSPPTQQTLLWLNNDLAHPSVNGISSYGIMNTSQSFSSLPTTTKTTNILTQDWYLYPVLAGPYTIGGNIYLGLWINASGTTPKGTPTIYLYQRFANGSEAQVPGTGSSLGSQSLFNTPHYLNLSVSVSSYTFEKGSSIHLVFNIQCGTSVTCEIWYGSQSYDSRLSLPSETFMSVSSIATYNANMQQTSIYSDGWNSSQRKVVVLANVTDPFGAYDARQVNVSILFVATSSSVLSAPMNLTGVVYPTNYSEIYEGIWSYPSTAAGGNYSVTVQGVDYTGIYYKNYFGNLNYGSYVISRTIYFSIGTSVPLTVLVKDSHAAPLGSAQVAIMNGQAVYGSGTTNSSGYWSGLVFNSSSYNIVVDWEKTLVANQSVLVSSASTVSVTSNVYYPVIKTTDSNGNPLGNAELFFTFPNGSSTTLPLFTSTGSGALALSRVPGGNWKISVYWQNQVVDTQTLNMASDGPYVLATNVFSLSVKVTDGSGGAVSGAYVIVYNGNAVQGFNTTGSNGIADFQLPIGNYTVKASYTGNYWLTQSTGSGSKPISLSSSQSMALPLSNYPPPLMSTVGFLFLIGGVVALAAIIAGFYFVSRKKKQ